MATYEGWTGADLALLVNESAVHAVRSSCTEVCEGDFIFALEKVQHARIELS